MNCQIISDLHCDFGENWMYMRNVPVLADTLIVAGDMMPLKHPKWSKFCNQVLSRWRRVIYVPGNHDYYGMNAKDDIDKISSSNVRDTWKHKGGKTDFYMLNNQVLELDGINFICSTLWSQIDKYPLEIMKGLSDYSYIYGYNIVINNSLHEKSCSFINSAIDALNALNALDALENNGKCVVITHHVPLYHFIHPKFHGSVLNEAFASNLVNMLERHGSKIGTWIFGHTHTFFQENFMGVDFVCNPLGYYELKEQTGFNDKLVLNLKGN